MTRPFKEEYVILNPTGYEFDLYRQCPDKFFLTAHLLNLPSNHKGALQQGDRQSNYRRCRASRADCSRFASGKGHPGDCS